MEYFRVTRKVTQCKKILPGDQPPRLFRDSLLWFKALHFQEAKSKYLLEEQYTSFYQQKLAFFEHDRQLGDNEYLTQIWERVFNCAELLRKLDDGIRALGDWTKGHLTAGEEATHQLHNFPKGQPASRQTKQTNYCLIITILHTFPKDVLGIGIIYIFSSARSGRI